MTQFLTHDVSHYEYMCMCTKNTFHIQFTKGSSHLFSFFQQFHFSFYRIYSGYISYSWIKKKSWDFVKKKWSKDIGCILWIGGWDFKVNLLCRPSWSERTVRLSPLDMSVIIITTILTILQKKLGQLRKNWDNFEKKLWYNSGTTFRPS